MISPRARDVADPRRIELEHVAVQEDDRCERLVLRGRRDTAIDREVRQEVLEFARPEFARMPTRMEADVVPDPHQVKLLRAQAQAPRAHAVAHHIEQSTWRRSRRRQRRQRRLRQVGGGWVRIRIVGRHRTRSVRWSGAEGAKRKW